MMTPNRSNVIVTVSSIQIIHIPMFTYVIYVHVRIMYLEGITGQHARHLSDIRKEHLCADLELNSKM